MIENTFAVSEFRLGWFSDVIVSALPDPTASMSILDIGCGVGDQIFDLAERLPAASFVGVDIVHANIEAAERRRLTSPAASRVTFVEENYRTYTATHPFDLAFSYSVLQFLPDGVDALADRLSADVRPGGTFVNVMARRCGYNTGLAVVRRLLTTVRSAASDRVLLAIARLLQGGMLTSAQLSERIPYAYATMLQWEEDLASRMERCRWVTTSHGPIAHASLAQMKHALRVMHHLDAPDSGHGISLDRGDGATFI